MNGQGHAPGQSWDWDEGQLDTTAGTSASRRGRAGGIPSALSSQDLSAPRNLINQQRAKGLTCSDFHIVIALLSHVVAFGTERGYFPGMT